MRRKANCEKKNVVLILQFRISDTVQRKRSLFCIRKANKKKNQRSIFKNRITFVSFAEFLFTLIFYFNSLSTKIPLSHSLNDKYGKYDARIARQKHMIDTNLLDNYSKNCVCDIACTREKKNEHNVNQMKNANECDRAYSHRISE